MHVLIGVPGKQKDKEQSDKTTEEEQSFHLGVCEDVHDGVSLQGHLVNTAFLSACLSVSLT